MWVVDPNEPLGHYIDCEQEEEICRNDDQTLSSLFLCITLVASWNTTFLEYTEDLGYSASIFKRIPQMIMWFDGVLTYAGEIGSANLKLGY